MKIIQGFIPEKKLCSERGSSLIGMAIMTLALGFLVTGGIFLIKNYSVIKADQTSVEYFRDIQTALNDFVAREGRYPCPAPLTVGIDEVAADGTEFGKEGAGSCAGGPVHDGTFRANGTGGTVRIGAVPVRTLHLSDRQMMDGYGKRYFYAITEALAVPGTDVRNDEGAITLENESGDSLSDAAGRIVYALMSPGTDDRGAFDAEGNQILNCNTSTDAGKNCRFLTSASPNADFISSTVKKFNVGDETFTHSFAFHANSVPYKWDTGVWDPCNGVCFSGDQNRSVSCRDHKGKPAKDATKCNHTAKPIGYRVCSLPPCYWDTSGWATCVPGTGIGDGGGLIGLGGGGLLITPPEDRGP